MPFPCLYTPLLKWREDRVELCDQLGMCFNNRGSIRRIEGKFSDAFADYEMAVGLYVHMIDRLGRSDLVENLAKCLRNRAEVLWQQGKREQAESDLKAAAEVVNGVGLSLVH
ncbi:MAG TPA: tetratricopeptide repeat protein [Isosphaeraceae bacterium]|nr:tetratricopeptide repeat protein [Isosphaeraceae bacterium]